MATGRLAGHYLNVLGTGIVLGMVASPLFGVGFSLDFSFILYLWMGTGLLKGRSGRRTFTLVMFSLAILFSVGYLIAMQFMTGPVDGPGRALRTPQLASIHAAVLVLLFLPPVILLLLPSARRWFAEMRNAPPIQASISRATIGLYVLAACVPLGAGLLLERSTRLAEHSAVTGGFEYGESRFGVTTAGWMEEKSTKRRLFVTWLAFAEASPTVTMHEGGVSFDGRPLPIPHYEPVRYLFSPPSSQGEGGNVFFVRKDGTIDRMDRRVTPEHLESAQGTARGVRDFDELRRRLEAMLPRAVVASATP